MGAAEPPSNLPATKPGIPELFDFPMERGCLDAPGFPGLEPPGSGLLQRVKLPTACPMASRNRRAADCGPSLVTPLGRVVAVQGLSASASANPGRAELGQVWKRWRGGQRGHLSLPRATSACGSWLIQSATSWQRQRRVLGPRLRGRGKKALTAAVRGMLDSPRLRIAATGQAGNPGVDFRETPAGRSWPHLFDRGKLALLHQSENRRRTQAADLDDLRQPQHTFLKRFHNPSLQAKSEPMSYFAIADGDLSIAAIKSAHHAGSCQHLGN